MSSATSVTRVRRLRAVPTTAPVRIQIAPYVDPALALMLQTWPVCLQARFSGPSGTRSYVQSAQQLMLAADALADVGVDVRPLLPAESDLVDLLHAQEAEESVQDGKPFQHRHLELTDTKPQGLVVLLQCGTGVKVDDVSMHQPAALRIARVVQQEQCALVFTNEFERWGRGNVSHPIFHALRSLRPSLGGLPWIGDSHFGPAPANAATERHVIEVGTAAAQEAERIVSRTRGAQRYQGRSRAMQDGRARWPTGARPPFGLAAVRLRNPISGAPGDSIVFIDEPASRPDEAEVAYGLPQLFEVARRGREPQPVDQVAIVRWFFRTYLTQGWDRAATVAELERLQLSSTAVRRHRGDVAAVAGGPAGTRFRLCNLLLKDLEFYETGRLEVAAYDGGEPIVVTDVFPADGEPWVSVEDAERLRRLQAEQVRTRPRRRVSTFAGQPLAVDGAAGNLSHRQVPDGSVVYYVTREHSRQRLTAMRAAPALPIPHDDLVASIADALRLAGSVSLAPLIGVGVDVRQQQKAELARITGDITRLESKQAERKHKLDMVSKPTAVASIEEQLENGSRALAALQLASTRAAAALRQSPNDGRGLDLALLWDFLAALRDPYDSTYRLTLRDSIVGFTERTERLQHRDGIEHVVTWDFELLVRDPEVGVFRLPVHGERRQRTLNPLRAPRTTPLLVAAVDGLRAGVTLPETLGSGYKAYLPALRTVLGLPDGGRFMLTAIEDPRLLRIAMAIAHPVLVGPQELGPRGTPRLAGPAVAEADLGRLARRLREPAALLRRMNRVYVLEPPGGRTVPRPYPRGRQLAALYTAAAGGGSVRPASAVGRLLQPGGRAEQDWDDVEGGGRVRIRSCVHCRGTERVALRLQEVAGSVCLGCRRDREDVPWPEEYDIWRC
jgi:hypothetical protein